MMLVIVEHYKILEIIIFAFLQNTTIEYSSESASVSVTFECLKMLSQNEVLNTQNKPLSEKMTFDLFLTTRYIFFIFVVHIPWKLGLYLFLNKI